MPSGRTRPASAELGDLRIRLSYSRAGTRLSYVRAVAGSKNRSLSGGPACSFENRLLLFRSRWLLQHRSRSRSNRPPEIRRDRSLRLRGFHAQGSGRHGSTCRHGTRHRAIEQRARSRRGAHRPEPPTRRRSERRADAHQSSGHRAFGQWAQRPGIVGAAGSVLGIEGTRAKSVKGPAGHAGRSRPPAASRALPRRTLRISRARPHAPRRSGRDRQRRSVHRSDGRPGRPSRRDAPRSRLLRDAAASPRHGPRA